MDQLAGPHARARRVGNARLATFGLAVLLGAVPASLSAQGATLGAPTGPDDQDIEAQVLPKPKPTGPNILLILADDLGHGDLGCFGSDFIITPELDALAAQGMRLLNFSTNSAGCTPSRVSILTGTMATYHGFQSVNTNATHRGIPDAVTTLPDVLREGGYYTGHIGKWHIGEDIDDDTDEFLPLRAGFDWSARLFIPNQQTHWNPSVVLHETSTETHEGLHSTRVLTDYALDFLDQRSQVDGDKPWFLNLWYYAPHLPMQVPAAYLDLYPESDPTDPWTKYAAMVSQMDQGIGQVLDKLDELGMADNTLIMVLSDNGGSLSPGLHPDGNGDLKGGKGQFFDGGVRVPFIARWPDVIPANTQSSAAIYASDILPTAQQLAGTVQVLPHVEGRSMLPTLQGYEQSVRTQNFYWTGKAGAQAITPEHGITDVFAVRQDHTPLGAQDLKLVFTPQFQAKLYDMDTDPMETTSLVSSYPNTTQKLWNGFWQTRRVESTIPLATPTLQGEVFGAGNGFMFFNGVANIESDAWLDFHNGNFTSLLNVRVQKLGVEQVLLRKAGSFELVLTASDQIQLTLEDATGDTELLTAPVPVTLGQNVQVGFTVSRWTSPLTDNTVTLWVDGAEADSGTVSAVATNRNDVQLGNDADPPLGTRPFKGVISALEFHNVSFNRDEIAGSWPPIPAN